MSEPSSACFLCTKPLEPFPTGEPFEENFERCLSCCMIFRKERARLNADEELRFYQTHQNSAEDPGYRRFLSKVTEPLKAKLSPGACGLDFGSGPAAALVALMGEAGHEMARFDPLFAPDDGSLARTYDFITCTEVVEHFKDPAADWALLFSLVRRGGTLAVMTEWYRGQSPLSSWRYARDPTHCAFYSRAALSRIGERHEAELEFPSDNVCFFSP